MKRRGLLTKLLLGSLAAPSVAKAAIEKPIITEPPEGFIGALKFDAAISNPVPINSLGEPQWQYDWDILQQILHENPDLTQKNLEDMVVEAENTKDDRGLLIYINSVQAVAQKYRVLYARGPRLSDELMHRIFS